MARLCQREGEARYALPGRRGLYVPRAVIELLLMFRMEADAEMLRSPSGPTLSERVGRLIADHISPPAPGPDTRAVGLVALVTEIVRIEVQAALARERGRQTPLRPRPYASKGEARFVATVRSKGVYGCKFGPSDM